MENLNVSRDVYILVWSTLGISFVIIGALVGFVVRYVISHMTKSVDSLGNDMKVMEKSVSKLNNTIVGVVMINESSIARLTTLEVEHKETRKDINAIRNDITGIYMKIEILQQ